ncbi:MAG: 16S rRNA (cytosine(1402)-N(4))-methyltransferase RsmH [Acidobacteria bacterium]|nr:16S rRNA (cytosine(1402)-N(4))-methyltransferase RsmH [Acidobacteriota bacterium]
MNQIQHVPVLLQEVLDTLQPSGDARILDLTLGLGGHAEALLAQCGPGACYLGVDRDPEARARAQARLGHDPRLTILASAHEDAFDHPGYQAWKAEHAPEGFDAILADLGVSTLQLRTADRGFSFANPGPLDMRMDTEHGPTALEWIAEQDDQTLADALYQFGEERASRPIARAILRRLAAGTLQTTADLASAIYEVLPKEIAKRKKQVDPATRSFQAIRIAVNGELARLGATVERAVTQLKPGGRLGVISFHSLEDRIVKQTLRRLAGTYDGPGRVAPVELPKVVKLIHPGGLAPTPEESQSNPPSRSARLRVAEHL